SAASVRVPLMVCDLSLPSVIVLSTSPIASSVSRAGGTISAGAVEPSAGGDSPRPSGRIESTYGGSLGRERGTWTENESAPRAMPAFDTTLAENPGPPRNREGRVTTIFAAIVVVSHGATAQYASIRPLIVTDASSTRSPIQ